MAISRNVLVALGILLLAGIGAAAWIHSSQSGPAPLAASAVAAPYTGIETSAPASLRRFWMR